MGMTGALRGAALVLAASVAAAVPLSGAGADDKLPGASAKPAATAAPHAPKTADGLSPQVTALAADAPNTQAGARTNSVLNNWISETLPAGDNDWYRFQQVHTQWVRILLGDQVTDAGDTNDYAIILYNSAGHEVKRSVRGSGVAEELYLQLSPGFWFVRVLQQTGGLHEAPDHPYVLRYQQYNDGMAFNGLNFFQAPNTNWYLAGEAINNTSQYRTITADVQVFDASNRVLKTAHVAVFHLVTAPRGRSPFVFSLGQLPDTLDHFKTTLTGTPTTSRAITGLSTVRGAITDNGEGAIIHGTVRNNSAANRVQVRVSESLFSVRGELLYLGYESSSYPLAVHQTHSYAVALNQTAGAIAIREDYTGR
jgi:hypothetical protein